MTDFSNIEESLSKIREAFSALQNRVETVVIGQRDVVRQILLCTLTGTHALLEGVPGLAKTTLISAIAESLNIEHGRIQFTPDLMPADILGAEFLEEEKSTGARHLRFEKGPVFTQILLADEINRTPPKTQSALLQAMQEKSIVIAGKHYDLPFPFLVFATQNPIENEGTYPLPEAQLDRFMLKIIVDYPAEAEEKKIAVLSPRELPAIQKLDLSEQTSFDWSMCYQLLDEMPVTENVIEAAVGLARSSRPEGSEDEFIRQNIRWGAGPRASQFLIFAAKGWAILDGRATPVIEDLKAVAKPVLRHRIIPSFSAEAEHLRADDLIEYLIQKI